jgi:uncharacterized protein (DUF58 family)
VPRTRPGKALLANIPRPTRLATTLFSFAILLELLGRLVGSTAITIAAAAALGAVIGDAALTPRVDAIVVHRRGPKRTTAGDTAVVRFGLSQPKRPHAKLAPVIFNATHPAFVSAPVLTPEVPRGHEVGVTLTVTTPQRGYWDAPENVTLEAHSPLGGFVRRGRFTFTPTQWVHPAPAAPISLPDLSLGAESSVAGSGRAGHGTEFFGIREWRSGDAAGSVHWRASARRNQLIVMDRERPSHAAVVVLVGSATSGPEWELAVARAAATAVAVLRQGRSVTLICGQESLRPQAPRDALDWFAALGHAPTTGTAVLSSELRQLEPGATVLWLATTAMPDSITQLTRAAGARVESVRSTHDLQVRR